MGYIITFFMKNGQTFYVHKDGGPTLNRDSAYVFPTYEMAKHHADLQKARPNKYRKWGFGFIAVGA